jgi:poly(hydroxyalkanoate) depolymerase family esterase
MATGLRRYEFSERLADILGESRRDLRFRVTMLVSGGLVAPGPRGRGSPLATPQYAAKLLLGSMAAPQQSHTLDAIRCYERLRPTVRTVDTAVPRVTLGPRTVSVGRSAPPAIPLLCGHRTFGDVLTRLLELATAAETREKLARELFGIWVSRGYPVSAVQLGAWTEGQRNILSQRYELAEGARPPAWLDPKRDGNPDPGLYHTLFLPASKLVEIGKLTSFSDKERPPMINLGPKMARISKLAELVRQTRFRGRWEKLLQTLATVQAWSDQVDIGDSRLVEVRDFGSNPGQLRMLTYVPDHLPASAPLVVLLHGCTQNGVSFDKGTGWSTLADRFGFALLLPEQHWTNNPLRCFNWFRPEDTRRDGGEALSIKQMIDRVVKDHWLDPGRVYVTGLSSGGAMTSVMLATYPDLFAGGAILAGVPYRSADNMQEAFSSIFQGRSRAAWEWGDLVREASSHRGPWPRVSVWHGDADSAVAPVNAEEIVKQWTDVHGVAGRPHIEKTVDGHPHRVWHGADGEHLVESFTIVGMSHGAPLSTGDQPHQCGTAAPFFNDVGISSAFHIARFWGLHEQVSGASVSASTAYRAQPEVIDLSRDAVVGVNDHGARATPKNVRRVRHDRFPHPNPLPGGEEDVERATRDFHREERVQPEGVRARGRREGDEATGSPSSSEAERAGAGDTDRPSDPVVGVLLGSREDEGRRDTERDEQGYGSSARGAASMGINVHGIVRKSLEAAGLVTGEAPGSGGLGGFGGMPFGIDVPGIIGTSLEAAGVLKGFAQGSGPETSGKTTADSRWEGEGWELLVNEPGSDRGGPILFGQVSSGLECDVGKKVRSTSRKVALGPRPELSYVRRLNLNAAVNDYTSASFSVLVEGTPVDEANAVGMDHVEAEWLQRSDIDLSRFADRTVTLTFEVTASSNVCSEVSAKAWVDRIRIKSVSSV